MEILGKSETGPTAVIGAGASGVLTAIALLRSGRGPVTIVEHDPTWSTGPAYATRDAGHLLNVPAAKLSADPACPDDFVEWAATRVPDVTPGSFLPRRLFGAYLRASLDRAARARPGALTRVTAEAVALDEVCRPGRDTPGVRIAVRHGSSIVAEHVVLALGNPPSRRLECCAGTVINDPWRVCASDVVGADDAVVIVGVGLTAVDVALTLVDRGHRGPICMVSRRGLFPRAHEARQPAAAAVDGASTPTARAALAQMRAAIAEAGGDWRAVFDGMRPHSNDVWRALPAAERARLLRHAARYWEVHRHRIAPAVADRFAALVASGRVNMALGDAGCGERLASFGARWIVNCTGPDFDVRRWDAPLVQDLFGSGLARPGPLGLGVDVDDAGALIDGSGTASPAVSVVGPLRRGAEWETTAVPEIRAQAYAVALRALRGNTAGHGHVAKSGWATRGASDRPLGSSHSSWRPSAVRSRK